MRPMKLTKTTYGLKPLITELYVLSKHKPCIVPVQYTKNDCIRNLTAKDFHAGRLWHIILNIYALYMIMHQYSS